MIWTGSLEAQKHTYIWHMTQALKLTHGNGTSYNASPASNLSSSHPITSPAVQLQIFAQWHFAKHGQSQASGYSYLSASYVPALVGVVCRLSPGQVFCSCQSELLFDHQHQEVQRQKSTGMPFLCWIWISIISCLFKFQFQIPRRKRGKRHTQLESCTPPMSPES